MTTHSSQSVVVSWQVSPDDHGATVTSYPVVFLKADGVSYVEDTANCDASDPVIFAARSCSIPMSAFRDTYGLAIDALVVGTVTATNNKGTSTASPVNTAGAVVQNVP